MAYIFKQDELPSLIDAKQARERIFFVNQELANIDDMLAGVMYYKKGAASPLHLHKNCEHFYFIIDGQATVESDEGIRPVGPGDMIFIPAEERIGSAPRRRCSISNGRRRTVSRPPSSTAPTTTCAGSARTARCGCRAEGTIMALTFIDTNKLPKIRSDGAGQVTEVLNQALCGAKNVLGSLRWLNGADVYKADAAGKHQLVYVMDGKGSIGLNGKKHAVEKGGGIYLGPTESATFKAAAGTQMKLFQLVVPKVPK